MKLQFLVPVLTTLALGTFSYQLVSIAGHVAITQLVDKPVYGVHVRMAKSTFK